MRWLHCSDFHIGKDRVAQERLVGRIIEQVKSQAISGFVPDMIFLTGDIANSGVKREYDEFRRTFLQPLREILGGLSWNGRIFSVPGNHDVDRTRNSTFDHRAPVAPRSKFFDPSKAGKQARDILAPRFKAFRQGAVGDLSGDWISRSEGTFQEKIKVGDLYYGIVGINTAWLSKDEADQHRLSPGVEIVEAALEEIKDCSVKFVLGHHPLNWFDEEHSRRLRALFGHHRVIYLHGHLHRAEGSQEDGAGNNFVVVQAGSAFQARDDEQWRNGILWGEIDVRNHKIKLSPRYWNPANYDWPVETGRYPENRRIAGTDWWAYELPVDAVTLATSKLNGWVPPEGWEVLNAKNLLSKCHNITGEEARRFFEGAEPDWALALSPKLLSRRIVSDLSEELNGYNNRERPIVILLTGPGGEGKSTALRQTISSVVNSDDEVSVLWHIDESKYLPVDFFSNLPKGKWIIATDAADIIAKSLVEGTVELQRIGRTDVKLLLCARDTDWHASGADKLVWQADYRVHNLSGLTEEDAILVAANWANFDDSVNDKNSERWIYDSAKALFDATRDSAEVSEGSLLGGVLTVRYGKDLRGHVARLMDRLQEYRLSSGHSLLDAFAYIAVMHAEGFDFMSRPVLASVLNCSQKQLAQQVIVPLAREAAANGGSVLLTRHRRIAHTAVELLRTEFGEDIGDRLEELARAAKNARSNSFIPQYARWEYDLPEKFIQKSPETAIRIGQAILSESNDDPKLAVNLAQLYRKCGDPVAGADLLRDFAGSVTNDRGFWHEWGTCAGVAGEKALAALLDGWSIADQVNTVRPDVKAAKLGLVGMGIAFGDLYDQYKNRSFITAMASSSYLGLQLPLDSVTRGYLESNQKGAEVRGGSATGSAIDNIDKIHLALREAWEVCPDSQNILSKFPSPSEMKFEGLARLFVEL